MKKLLLLGALLASTAMQAQTTYYWPGERVTTLTSGEQYFIYNTMYTPGQYADRSWFIFSNGSNLNADNTDPKDLVKTNTSYIFTLEKPAAPTSENHWYIKSANGYVGFGGATNKQSIDEYCNIYITYWHNNTNLKLATGGQSEDENGEHQALDVDTKTWAITKDETNNSGNANDYAWNGNNVTDPGVSTKAWTRYASAHPYAFYTVKSKTIDAETQAHIQEQTNQNGLISDIAFNLQKKYGLVQDGDKYYCNYPTAVASENSSYANLIDGNDGTKFHTSYAEKDIAEGTPRHYLRAELPEAKSSFYFITKRRTDNNNNRPTTILIEGSNDDNNYETITTVSGLPTAESEYFYFSGKISTTDGTSYKYIRFTPTAISGNTKYFTYSEFYVIDANETTEKIMNDISSFRSYDVIGNIKNENVLTEFQTKYQAVYDDNKILSRSEAQTLLDENAQNHSTTPALGQYPTDAYNKFKSIVENQDATEEELTAAITEFKLSINAPVFTINGAFIGSGQNNYNTTGHSIYYAAENATQPWRWDKETNKYDATMLWKFMEGTSSTLEKDKAYTVTNVYGDLYFWNATAVIISDPTGDNPDGKVLIKLQSQSNPVHADRNGYTLTYPATDASSASAWTLTYVGESYKISQINKENLADYAALKPLVTECEPYRDHIGEGLNKFSCEGYDFDALLTAAEEISNQDIYENPELDATTALNNLQAAKGALVINQPEPGKFYRIKGASGKYISSEAISTNVQGNVIYKLKMTDTKNKSTVLFLSEDNRITTEKMQNMSRAGVHLNGLGSKYIFTAHQTAIGKYVITPSESPDGNIGGTTNSPLYDYSDTDNAVDQISDANDANCAWTIEEVTDLDQQPNLSKTIGSTGYATLGAPVALNIPSDVKAYTVTVSTDQTKANLNEITGDIIPAGVGVVLKAESTSTDFTFTFNSGADAPTIAEGDNALTPLYTETTIGDNVNAYILADKEQGLGFYLLDQNSTNRTVGANKAYLVLPEGSNAVRSILFGGPTTGIENTVATDSEKEEYYDLQGRRVMNPEKGIYITKSGKKVIFTK